MDPVNPDIVYAGLWEARQGPWEFGNDYSGTHGGLFKSTDGGNTFTAPRLIAKTFGSFQIAVPSFAKRSALIGVSTHDQAQARAAVEGGADYLGFGPCFPTATKLNPDPVVGLERLRCVHVNDAAAPLGSCRDRHANIGKGEMGKQGLSAFLSEPRFEGLPATLETPGPEKKGSDRKEVTAAKRLRREGLKRRQG